MRNKSPPYPNDLITTTYTSERRPAMCMNPVELNACVQNLKEMRSLQDRIAEKIKALEDQIKLHMADTDEFTLVGDGYKVSWNEVSSSRLDTAALKRELPDIAEHYTRQTVTRRFIVT